MSIHVLHNGEVKEAVPYIKHNSEVKKALICWTKQDGKLKLIWPKTMLIYDEATLIAFRELVNAGATSLNGIVTDDFALSDTWTPIGSSSKPYTGTFDGGEHTITGLTIDSTSSYQGLFSYLDSNGTVKNLTLSNVSISGAAADYIGAIAGYNEGTIENCHIASGTVTNSTFVSYAGGIVGYNRADITGCTNEGEISGDTAGGIVGYNNSSGSITGCSNEGEIDSADNAGGIVGENRGGVTDCTNTGTVTATGTFGAAGGIVGYNNNSGSITGCSNEGEIDSTGYAGGIIGQNYGDITDCTNSGSVTATGNFAAAGGIVGRNYGDITDCTNTGTVTGNGSVGDIIGK